MGFQAAAACNNRLCSRLILKSHEIYTLLAVTAMAILLTLDMRSQSVCDEALGVKKLCFYFLLLA